MLRASNAIERYAQSGGGGEAVKPSTRAPRLSVSPLRRVLSVPIYIKILGIGAMVAAIFAGVTVFYSKPRITETLYALHEDRVRATAVSLAASLERPLLTGDVFMLNQHLANTRLAYADVRYAVVYDAEGDIVAHTFDGDVPAELRRAPSRAYSMLRVDERGEGQVFEVVEPIRFGEAGYLRMGAHDDAVAAQLESLTDSVLAALLVCVVLGQLLALLLATILTRPIRNLSAATAEIRAGRFEHRAEVLWRDEVGDLTEAFNDMAQSLETYRNQVDANEEKRRELIKRLVQAQEDERRAIALELHDELGQSLMAALLTVHGMRKRGDVTEAAAAEIERQIRAAADDVRAIARRMRPSVLDHGGLGVALSSYVEETAARTDVEIDFQGLGADERLPSEVEVTLYRIAQESLTNVLRHAAANQASIVYSREKDAAALLIEDDGVGFDISCLDEREGCGGLGLMGMRERATLLGGQLHVSSTPGMGTTIRVRIPTNNGRYA